MNITIRRVVSEDLEAVAKVEMDCFPKAEAATKATFKERINIFPESFFVAEVNGKIIGFINGCVTDEAAINDELYGDITLHNSKGAYQTIFGLDVVKEYRKLGVAAQLMQHMIEAASLAGRKGVVLTCKELLIHYYEKFGYVNKGISKSKHGGVVWYDMLLEIKY